MIEMTVVARLSGHLDVFWVGSTLSRSGHTEGTSANPFGPDRDDEWISSGNNPTLRERWPQVQEAVVGWRIGAQDLLGQALSAQIQKAAEEALKELAKKGIEAGIAALIALL